MIVNGIDTLSITYNLQECGISKANVIDAMYTKKESWQYETGGNNIKYTEWKGDFISPKENVIHGYLNDSNLTIHGSIPKFIYGNNFQGITKEDVTNAFDNLGHVIGADLYQGNVTRVDYASNLFMDYNPKLYYRFFGDSYKFKRINYGTSVAWKGNRGQARYKTIEDKTAWAKDTRNKIPDTFQDKNIIRYENRLTTANRISHVLGMGSKKATLKDVLRIDNLLKIHDDWKRQFFKIQKQNNLIDYSKYMQQDYYTPQEALTCYIMSLMNEAGEEGSEDFMKFIREGQKLGTGQTGYNNTSKFKKKIKALKTNWIRNENDMICEIDEKVKMTDYML
jgi:hypothetical protein